MPSWPLRVAGAGARVLQAHAGRLGHPLKINLCVTYWCQYRCQTCNIWQRKPTDELSTDELLAFVDRNRRTEWLDVTGGEIFLRPDIETILDAILRTWTRLVVLHFPTNGFLTDRIVPMTERLARSGGAPLVVTVSLDGDEALNDEIRGVRGGYRRQIETFRGLRRLRGVTAVLGMTISRLNAAHVERVFEACRRDVPDLAPRDFHVNVAQTSAHYYGTAADAAFPPSPREAGAALDTYRRLRGSPRSPTDLLEARYLRLLRRFVDTGVTPMPCHALRSSCFVDPWGAVFPCITYARPVGQLRDHAMDLTPIWAAEAATGLQREIWRGECPQCWTACEAYQTMLGNLLTPWRLARALPPPVGRADARHPSR